MGIYCVEYNFVEKEGFYSIGKYKTDVLIFKYFLDSSHSIMAGKWKESRTYPQYNHHQQPQDDPYLIPFGNILPYVVAIIEGQRGSWLGSS